ncbi:MAG: hypothetical protein PWQ12_1112 [Clostridiales bacterium]|jgi:uncharacterized membrane protein YheB (UPF0754 family)|nr:hypothetical protein [Clostridiales bacterium]
MEIIALMAIIGALIGWLTNVIAIKLLFRPIEPFRLPLLPFELQGLIPKRKSEIARSIGEVVEEELLSMEDVVGEIVGSIDKAAALEMIKGKVMTVVSEKMPAIIPSMFKGLILQNVEQMIDENGVEVMENMIQELGQKAIGSVDISKMVEDRILAYDLIKIEAIIIRIAKNELKHIEVLGGVLGFAIGVVQGLLVVFVFRG